MALIRMGAMITAEEILMAAPARQYGQIFFYWKVISFK